MKIYKLVLIKLKTNLLKPTCRVLSKESIKYSINSGGKRFRPYLVYVFGKEFQLPKGQGSLFCRLKEQDETQQRVPLDVSEYTRKLIHVKIAKEQNGLW